MQVFTDINDLPNFQRPVLTIGSFDGVHQGHQSLLQLVKNRAKEVEGTSVVLTFSPHPRIALNPTGHGLELLTSNEEKTALIAAEGIDVLVYVPFDKAFAAQIPEDYISLFLVRIFQPHSIVIGYDHRFGMKRSGDINMLVEKSTVFGYCVKEIAAQLIDNIAVSSTKVRNALSEGQVEAAASLLGHPYQLTGTVVYGDQIGRSINYPTANIGHISEHKLIPGYGVYAVTVTLPQGEYKGMLYIGERPTINRVKRVVEVHIFDFSEDIYDAPIQVSFVARIRGNVRFDSLEALAQQLDKDAVSAKSIMNIS